MAEPCFAALPGDALRRVRLGGLEAAYHAPSGITHLLAEPLPDLLDALMHLGADRFATSAEIVSGMSDRFDLVADSADEPPERVVCERLCELAALGLVRMRRQA